MRKREVIMISALKKLTIITTKETTFVAVYKQLMIMRNNRIVKAACPIKLRLAVLSTLQYIRCQNTHVGP